LQQTNHFASLSSAVAIICTLLSTPASAAVITTGDVTPDPTTTTINDDLYVGDTADGTMTIDTASSVDIWEAYVGYATGVTGTITVDGPGSIWNNIFKMYLGFDGTGTLKIQNGGTVANDLYSYLGYNSGSSGTATVTGPGSNWTNSDNLYVGHSGTGTLNIQNGGTVTNTIGYIGGILPLGPFNLGVGTVTVAGAGSIWTNSDSLRIGDAGNGTLNFQSGGEVSNSTGYLGYYLGYYLGSTAAATVTGAGSMWNISGDLSVGIDGTATLDIENGGAVTVGGNFTINSLSTLGLALTSTSDPFLDITGSATLAGTLDLSLFDSFMPNLGDSFQIMTFASHTGTFDSITGSNIGSGLTLDTIYRDSNVTVVVIPEPATFTLLAVGGLLMLRRRPSP
jgi:T5SS/PEP-CTERM-associated repeat protein